tara:strand:- start:846 stop:1400 length:555 start_codon:yes stop_codon:yes gene_type:complete
MATKDVKAKVKKPKVKAEAPVKDKETLEDRLTLAYYMLAGVVDKNTQCMAALLTALEMAAETQAQNATHLKVVPPPQEPIPIKSVIETLEDTIKESDIKGGETEGYTNIVFNANPEALGEPEEKLHVYTVSECQKVLLGVGGAKGKQTAFELLKKYGAERISELSPADFHLFVEDGNKIIEGEL